MRDVTTAVVGALLALEAMALVAMGFFSMAMYAVGLTDVGEPWGVTTGIPVIAVFGALLLLTLCGVRHVVRVLGHRTRRRSWSLLALAAVHGAYGTSLLLDLEGRPQYGAAFLLLAAAQTVAAAKPARGFAEYRLA
ncbi:hypothetical protein GCM10020229_57280 [Kitasatospora albolonga]|uniref:hypothetical protein n=1 Tax=Kitasatospora albolonga TaxID=68173 RepID=UPI0031F0F92F